MTCANTWLHDLMFPGSAATRPCDQRKRLRLAKSMAQQPLPSFHELLEEMARSWGNCLYSSRSPISGASSFDCKTMDTRGMALRAVHEFSGSCSPPHSPVIIVLQASFQQIQTVSSLPCLSSYRATALNNRVMNILLLLASYQAELFEDYGRPLDPVFTGHCGTTVARTVVESLQVL